jgi:ABC-2 type transport system ATP-binding protein
MNIEVRNLTKKFKNYLAVNNINFTLESGKTLGLLGPNGCGKTTSIGMMLGVITPSGGEVLINDQNVNSANHNDLLSI